mmetsp:Transcript_21557/g.69417  ORF Transcript_21557/g.69417 Transcript_21557/m.69417 type:complete len:243 (+) Transcript_21557:115-843(+)
MYMIDGEICDDDGSPLARSWPRRHAGQGSRRRTSTLYDGLRRRHGVHRRADGPLERVGQGMVAAEDALQGREFLIPDVTGLVDAARLREGVAVADLGEGGAVLVAAAAIRDGGGFDGEGEGFLGALEPEEHVGDFLRGHADVLVGAVEEFRSGVRPSKEVEGLAVEVRPREGVPPGDEAEERPRFGVPQAERRLAAEVVSDVQVWTRGAAEGVQHHGGARRPEATLPGASMDAPVSPGHDDL